MEAIFAGSLDLAFVGPYPAINAYARSGGDEIRVVAGAMTGGSALVVQGDADLAEPEDFRGRRDHPRPSSGRSAVCRLP
jgi:NitT/TauT family transport system substrate-binding protein